jgi:succinate dehydrogenase/fumarate reductase flavoprotein subunit
VSAVAGPAAMLLPDKASAAPASVPGRWDYATDLVVVGSGGGLAGAIAGRYAGMDVVCLEKMNVLGGSTAMHSGVMSCGGGTSLQKAAGITDTPDDYYAFLMACARGQADPDVVRMLSQRIPETFEWLVSIGAQFSTDWLYDTGPEAEPYYTAITPSKMRGAQYPPSKPGETTTGYLLHGFVVREAQKKGVRIFANTTAKELVVGTTGEVLGVKAEKDGAAIYIKARKGVILAAGGMCYNKAMLAQHIRYGDKLTGVGGPGATGDGIKMGQQVGGDLRNMSESLRSPGVAVILGQTTRGKTRASFPSILVNMWGKRFVNEDYHSDSVGVLARAQDEGLTWQIFDSASYAAVSATNKAKLIQSDTIAGLAKAAGINVDGLVATVQQWNADAASGVDSQYGKSGATVKPFVTAPFYAFKSETIANVVHYGGLKVNADCQVIDSMGSAVPRLFAAGLDAGCGALGRNYPGSGTAVGATYAMSIVAARKISEATSWDQPVATKLALKATAPDVARGKSIVFKGSLLPVGASPAQIRLAYKKPGSSTWEAAQTVVSGADGRFSSSWKTTAKTAKGVWSWRAEFGGADGWTTQTSPEVKVRVR